MRKSTIQALFFFCGAVLSTYPATAQDVTAPTFEKFQNADGDMLYGLSNNGQWSFLQSGMSDGTISASPKLYNVATGETTNVLSDEQLEQTASCNLGDVTDDGTLVGSVNGKPAYWSRTTGQWTELAMSTYSTGCAYAVTPDGKYAVGSFVGASEYNEYPAMWDLTTGELITLEGLPEYDISGRNDNEMRLTGISPDGRYITGRMSWVYVQPAQVSSFIYDRETKTSKMLGYEWTGTRWKALDNSLYFVDGPVMSPNGLWLTGEAYIVGGGGNESMGEYSVPFRYNVAEDKFEFFDETNSIDFLGFAIDNNGTIYGATPGTTTPLRNWSVLHGKYWYSISSILSSVYGMDFTNATGYEWTGTPIGVSEDRKKVIAFVDPHGESYVLTLPQPLDEVCADINLMGNYTVTPASGSEFSRLRQVEVLFDRDVQVTGAVNAVTVKDASGNVVASSLAFDTETNNSRNVVISFRTLTLNPGEQYTVEIPAGTITIKGDAEHKNEAIQLTYTGRANEPIAVTSVSPAEGTEMQFIDYSSNPVIFTFDTNVSLTGNQSAQLVRTDDGTVISSLQVAYKDNQVAVYPASTQYLFKGSQYKVVLNAGSVSDVAGNNANEEYSVNYVGAYQREVSSDDQNIFSDDFNSAATSIVNFMLYEGDHNTPSSEMQAWGFDADNSPWNFTVRDDNGSDFVAASHSMYEEAGASDDWMITPQLYIPDARCQLTFDAQSYRNSATDRLKVMVWPCDEAFNSATADMIARFKAEGTVVFDEQLSPGASEETLAGDWTSYTVDLSAYAGKDIYIALVNENTNQSAIFVNDLAVTRNMPYLLSLNTDETVVNQESLAISGTLTANSDDETYSTLKMTLKNEAGETIGELEAANLNLSKGDSYTFAFDEPLPLEKGKENKFTIDVQLDDYADQLQSSVKNLIFQPEKRVVLEEYTGLDCPNCPLGILAIEKMREYAGSQVIPVSIHTYTGDPYSTTLLESYTSFLNLVGAPSGQINRSGVSYPMTSLDGKYFFYNPETHDNWLDLLEQELQVAADADINITASYNPDTKNIDIPVSVRYALDAKNQMVNLFTVVMEDGLVNYQRNNLSSLTDENLGEWANGGRYAQATAVGVTHNDVARICYGTSFNGTAGLLPSTITAGETYTATLSYAYPENIRRAENAKVAVMMIDANTGRVINAAVAKVDNLTGIGDVTADGASVDISAAAGQVNVATAGRSTVSVYTTTGLLLGTAQGDGELSVSTAGYRGVAIVKVSGATTTVTKKVVLK